MVGSFRLVSERYAFFRNSQSRGGKSDSFEAAGPIYSRAESCTAAKLNVLLQSVNSDKRQYAQSRTHPETHRKPHLGLRIILGRGAERGSAAQPLHIPYRQAGRRKGGLPLPRLRRPAGGDDRNAAAARRRGGLSPRRGQDGPRGVPRLGAVRQRPLPSEPQPAGRHHRRTELHRLPLRRQRHGPLRGDLQAQELHQQRQHHGGAPVRKSICSWLRRVRSATA